MRSAPLRFQHQLVRVFKGVGGLHLCGRLPWKCLTLGDFSVTYPTRPRNDCPRYGFSYKCFPALNRNRSPKNVAPFLNHN